MLGNYRAATQLVASGVVLSSIQLLESLVHSVCGFDRNGRLPSSKLLLLQKHVVLYGCETWSLTLREEHRLRVFENRVLRRIFGAKRD
jgi:hypothetical protein